MPAAYRKIADLPLVIPVFPLDGMLFDSIDEARRAAADVLDGTGDE